MKRIYYYCDELNDDFAGTKIKKRQLPKDYKFVRTDGGWKFGRFLVYKVFATPLIMLVSSLLTRVKNKRVMRGYKNGGAFIYGNHTAYLTDAMNPTRIAFPRTADILVNSDAVSIKGVGGLVRMLGGVPVPTDLHGLKNFSADIEEAVKSGHWMAIYPEAHIWPYYTGIRPFGAASFKYPAKCGVPVFAYTTVYRRRKFSRKPKKVVYVDGPFFAEGETLKEKAESLRAQVYEAMCGRAKLSDCVYCDYYKIGNPQLASALNGAQVAARSRGKKRVAMLRELAEEFTEINAEENKQKVAASKV